MPTHDPDELLEDVDAPVVEFEIDLENPRPPVTITDGDGIEIRDDGDPFVTELRELLERSGHNVLAVVTTLKAGEYATVTVELDHLRNGRPWVVR